MCVACGLHPGLRPWGKAGLKQPSNYGFVLIFHVFLGSLCTYKGFPSLLSWFPSFCMNGVALWDPHLSWDQHLLAHNALKSSTKPLLLQPMHLHFKEWVLLHSSTSISTQLQAAFLRPVGNSRYPTLQMIWSMLCNFVSCHFFSCCHCWHLLPLQTFIYEYTWTCFSALLTDEHYTCIPNYTELKAVPHVTFDSWYDPLHVHLTLFHLCYLSSAETSLWDSQLYQQLDRWLCMKLCQHSWGYVYVFWKLICSPLC